MEDPGHDEAGQSDADLIAAVVPAVDELALLDWFDPIVEYIQKIPPKLRSLCKSNL